MRICLIYDCLYPRTVGGAERTYRLFAERAVAAGHDLTYVTRRQWARGEDPGLPGARVVAVSPRSRLYTRSGRRRILPPLLFGLGVLVHLLRHGHRYDVVYTASFPYFGVLAVGLAARRRRFRVVVDWQEVWTLEYWQSYVGRLAGWIGWRVQRACVRVPQQAFSSSRMNAERLAAEGLHGEAMVLPGVYDGPLEPHGQRPAEPLVVLAGRLVAEKRPVALVGAVAAARERLPELRAEIFGDGPEAGAIARAIGEHGLEDAVKARGFAAEAEVQDALGRALCMVLPSRREGYGRVIVEAAALGTPSVVVAGSENAATELVHDDVNGVVAPSASSEDLARAILAVHAAGPALRRSTAAWFQENAPGMTVAAKVDALLAACNGAGSAP